MSPSSSPPSELLINFLRRASHSIIIIIINFLHISSPKTRKNETEQNTNIVYRGLRVAEYVCVCGQQGSKGSNSYGPPHHTRRTASTPFRPFTSPRNHKLYTGGKRRLWIRSLVTRDYEFSISFSVIVRIMCIASQRHGHGISMSF